MQYSYQLLLLLTYTLSVFGHYHIMNISRKLDQNLVKSVKATNFRPIDLRVNGYVSEVNDQLYCGSCWAFSASETLSGHYRRKYRQNHPEVDIKVLSPQELVDCVPESYHGYGCGGGWADDAMRYAIEHLGGGLEQWRDYPYTGSDGKCDLSKKNRTIMVNASRVMVVDHGNQTALLEALYKYGPLSVCLNASPEFMSYKSGIFTSLTCVNSTSNHCVLLYGLYYDHQSNKWAYMVRNSWGDSSSDNGYGFGIDGDIFMDAEVDNGNLCGIASFASYLT